MYSQFMMRGQKNIKLNGWVSEKSADLYIEGRMQKGEEDAIMQHSAPIGNVQQHNVLFEMFLPALSPCVT